MSYDSSVKRRLFTLALFLVLGAVLNVAVAWGFAASLQSKGKLVYYGRTTQHYPCWSWKRLEQTGTTIFASVVEESERMRGYVIDGELWGDVPPVETAGLPSWLVFRDPRATDAIAVSHVAHGWPFRAMRYWWTWYDASGGQPTVLPFHAIELSVDNRELRTAIPLHPIFAGFAINTFFYATILWLFVRGPVVLRRVVRRRRGRCPACGYPVGVSAVCTECGQPLPRLP